MSGIPACVPNPVSRLGFAGVRSSGEEALHTEEDGVPLVALLGTLAPHLARGKFFQPVDEPVPEGVRFPNNRPSDVAQRENGDMTSS